MKRASWNKHSARKFDDRQEKNSSSKKPWPLRTVRLKSTNTGRSGRNMDTAMIHLDQAHRNLEKPKSQENSTIKHLNTRKLPKVLLFTVLDQKVIEDRRKPDDQPFCNSETQIKLGNLKTQKLREKSAMKCFATQKKPNELKIAGWSRRLPVLGAEAYLGGASIQPPPPQRSAIRWTGRATRR